MNHPLNHKKLKIKSKSNINFLKTTKSMSSLHSSNVNIKGSYL